MAVVNIYRNTGNKHAKHRPSTEEAVKAWDNLDVPGTTAVHVAGDRVTPEHTSVTFAPPSTGNYETTYPNELAKVVKHDSTAHSWKFDWI